MKRDEILENIIGLSYSQGFYGRLYRNLMELKHNAPQEYEAIMSEMEAQEFKDLLDLVVYIEE